MSASRALFCVTSSPVRGAMLKRKTRGPSSAAMNRTRTAAGLPSEGSVTSCVPTIRPPSSTLSDTVSPAKPVCVMTASTTSELPLSAVRGVEIRSSWMSRASRSRPTPTVKTGTDAAFIASSASDSVASDVSAPSETRTMPASGRPAISCRTPSSAAPSFVCAPSNVRGSAAP
jgi:hypothetical protein